MDQPGLLDSRNFWYEDTDKSRLRPIIVESVVAAQLFRVSQKRRQTRKGRREKPVDEGGHPNIYRRRKLYSGIRRQGRR